MIVIAHLSDPHIDGGARSSDRLAAVMAHLDDLPHDLDAVLVTGDIADHGAPAEYQEAARLLRSRHPVLVCPGNHDDRSAFREHLLGEAPSTAPVNQVLRTPTVTIALADSSIPGRDDGRLDDATLAWLDETLSEGPAIVGFHHPPVPLSTPYVDGIRQFGEERLAEVLGRHTVTALVCGHAHTAAATSFAGLPLLVAPGVVSTLLLPWDRTGGAHVDLDDRPALAFHVIDDGRVTTHFRNVRVSAGRNT